MQAQINTATIENCPLPIIDVTECTDLSIYVASLSDYNAGILHGAWIDCSQGAAHVWEQIENILETSPYAARYGETAEEWAIHDFNFMGIQLSESEGIDELCELAEALEEHGEPLVAYLENLGTRDFSGFEDAFCGVYESEREYAEELAGELMPHDAPDFLTRYFDYEAFSRDLFLSDNFSVNVSEGVAVFRHI